MTSRTNPRQHGVKLTYEDYLSLPDDGRRYEILDGELAVTPPPLIRHQHVSSELFLALASWVKAHALGVVYAAPCGVILDEATVVEPDLVFVSKARRGIITERAVEGAPDLVVEILSPSTQRRDRGAKMHLYARFGIHDYWVVDPVERIVEVYVLRGASYTLSDTYSGNAVMRCSNPAGLEINLADVWPD